MYVPELGRGGGLVVEEDEDCCVLERLLWNRGGQM